MACNDAKMREISALALSKVAIEPTPDEAGVDHVDHAGEVEDWKARRLLNIGGEGREETALQQDHRDVRISLPQAERRCDHFVPERIHINAIAVVTNHVAEMRALFQADYRDPGGVGADAIIVSICEIACIRSDDADAAGWREHTRQDRHHQKA